VRRRSQAFALVKGTVGAESGVLFLEAFDQVVAGLMSGDRGYERLLSRNQSPAMTILAGPELHKRWATARNKVKPGNPGHDKAKV
jgi:hypothetical protein